MSVQASAPLKKRMRWWLLGFVLLPVATIVLYNSVSFVEQQLIVNELTLGIIFAIELLSAINRWFTQKKISERKIKLTLDNMVFGALLILSFIIALLFNSNEAPLLNQPIPFLIDLKHNFFNLISLLSYWLQIMVIYGCLYCIYLVNHHLLVKRILSQYGIFTYLWVTLLFLLTCYPILTQIALWLPLNNVPTPMVVSANHNPFDFWNLYIGVVVVVISTPIVMALKLQKDHLHLSQLQHDKLTTELKWLQQQINPHFLFNTLNNLYSLCLSKSAQAPDAILQLANLLRFVVYKGSDNRVALKDEISYLEDYLALQQLRVSNKCTFKVNIQPQHISGLTISPLLLVNFLENAIKHGVEPSNEPSWLNVDLTVEGTTLRFICENSIPKHAARQSNHSGIGLKNVSRRLALMYEGKHTLHYAANESSYKVNLLLTLENTNDLIENIQEK